MGSFYLGIDIGKTHFRVGMLDEQSKLVDYCKNAYGRTGYESLLKSITESIDERMDAIGASTADIGAIGVALPGIVNRETGLFLQGPDYDFMHGRSLGKDLAGRYSCTVVSDVDTIAPTWGELIAGVGKGCDRFALLTWGTSVGAGLVLDGRVISYRDNLFPEFGHSKVSDDDRACICGGRGCFATIVSGDGIALSGKEAAENGESDNLAAVLKETGGPITAAHVFDAAASGDSGARRILDRVGELFGRMYANLVYFCQPEQIVVTGGLTPRFAAIEPVVRKSMKRNCWLLEGGFTTCKPVMSTLGDTAGVIGAAAQARAKAEEAS